MANMTVWTSRLAWWEDQWRCLWIRSIRLSEAPVPKDPRITWGVLCNWKRWRIWEIWSYMLCLIWISAFLRVRAYFRFESGAGACEGWEGVYWTRKKWVFDYFGWGLWLGLIILNRSSFGSCIFLCAIQSTVRAASESAIWAVSCIHLILFYLPFAILDLSNRLSLLNEQFLFLATNSFTFPISVSFLIPIFSTKFFSFDISSFSLLFFATSLCPCLSTLTLLLCLLHPLSLPLCLSTLSFLLPLSSPLPRLHL